MSEEQKQEIMQFYSKDEISWQAPGRKDRVIIRGKDNLGNKVKTTLQTRYMLISLSEAHSLFCKESEIKVGLSKFCDLRPKHVTLFENIPHNICVCKYHENIRLLLTALKSYSTDLPENLSDFTDNLVCDSGLKQCMSQECPECKDKISQFAPSEDENRPVKYQQWQHHE